MPYFSQGKWKYAESSREIFAAQSEDAPFVLAIAEISFDNDVSEKEKHANGRLIAAAPELYEAVCELLDYAYEALHWAGGETEMRRKAPGIWQEIQDCQKLIDRVNGKEG